MAQMQKMTIVVPRKTYFNKLFLFLGKSGNFHFIGVNREKYDFELITPQQKTAIDNLKLRGKRLLEKFEFRSLKAPQSEKHAEKSISFKSEVITDLITSSDKIISRIEKKVSHFELNEGQIDKDFAMLSTKESDKTTFESIKTKRHEFKIELETIFTEYYGQVLNIYEQFDYISKFVKSFESTGGNDLIAVIMGWVPKKFAKNLAKNITELTNGKCSIKIEKPEKGDLPPTSLKRGDLLKPFEAITAQYGIPNYFELDPTKLVAFIFPLLFGLMFGDVGQGLVIMIAGGIMIYKTHRTIPKIIFWCGLGALLCGFLYGEFFGYSFKELGWFPPLLSHLPNIFTFLPAYNPTGASLIESNFILLIKFSLLIGTFLLLLGYFLKAINSYRSKKYEEILGSSLPTMLFIAFFMYCFFIFGLSFNEYLIPSPLTLGLIPLVFILIPILFLLFGKVLLSLFKKFKELHEESKKSIFGESLLNVWETGLGFISNISSFLRIFALIMSHWALNMVFRTIADMSTPGFSIVLIIVGNALIIIIETVLVLTQGIRLTFYEWFGKFYQGNGIKFSPFSLDTTRFKLEEE